MLRRPTRSRRSPARNASSSGFTRVELERRVAAATVTFTVHPSRLAFYDEQFDFVCEPGDIPLRGRRLRRRTGAHHDRRPERRASSRTASATSSPPRSSLTSGPRSGDPSGPRRDADMTTMSTPGTTRRRTLVRGRGASWSTGSAAATTVAMAAPGRWPLVAVLVAALLWGLGGAIAVALTPTERCVAARRPVPHHRRCHARPARIGTADAPRRRAGRGRPHHLGDRRGRRSRGPGGARDPRGPPVPRSRRHRGPSRRRHAGCAARTLRRRALRLRPRVARQRVRRGRVPTGRRCVLGRRRRRAAQPRPASARRAASSSTHASADSAASAGLWCWQPDATLVRTSLLGDHPFPPGRPMGAWLRAPFRRRADRRHRRRDPSPPRRAGGGRWLLARHDRPSARPPRPTCPMPRPRRAPAGGLACSRSGSARARAVRMVGRALAGRAGPARRRIAGARRRRECSPRSWSPAWCCAGWRRTWRWAHDPRRSPTSSPACTPLPGSLAATVGAGAAGCAPHVDPCPTRPLVWLALVATAAAASVVLTARPGDGAATASPQLSPPRCWCCCGCSPSGRSSSAPGSGSASGSRSTCRRSSRTATARDPTPTGVWSTAHRAASAARTGDRPGARRRDDRAGDPTGRAGARPDRNGRRRRHGGRGAELLGVELRSVVPGHRSVGRGPARGDLAGAHLGRRAARRRAVPDEHVGAAGPTVSPWGWSSARRSSSCSRWRSSWPGSDLSSSAAARWSPPTRSVTWCVVNHRTGRRRPTQARS